MPWYSYLGITASESPDVHIEGSQHQKAPMFLSSGHSIRMPWCSYRGITASLGMPRCSYKWIAASESPDIFIEGPQHQNAVKFISRDHSTGMPWFSYVYLVITALECPDVLIEGSKHWIALIEGSQHQNVQLGLPVDHSTEWRDAFIEGSPHQNSLMLLSWDQYHSTKWPDVPTVGS